MKPSSTCLLAALAVLIPVQGNSAALPAAPAGITALAGQILDDQAQPLAHVRLRIEPAETVTDAEGYFLLGYAPSGNGILTIDGRSAGTGQDHGIYEVRVKIAPGITNALPFVSYLPLIDHAQDVTFPSPTTAPVVIANPALSGAALQIPAGVVVRDAVGHAVTHLGITAYPAAHPPFPAGPRLDAASAFTIQPGAVCFETPEGKPASAQLFYPNDTGAVPGARAGFHRYDPRQGWSSYGAGTVNADGTAIVPDAATVLPGLDGQCPPAGSTAPAEQAE